jgi:ribosomal-protein-alanine N-acetyltransferase
MTHDDVIAVAAIERAAYDYPWSPGIFRDCLLAGYNAVVLQRGGGELIGYGIVSIAAAEAHLLNICIARARQHQGAGRQLLEYLMELCRDHGAERMFLEVRPSNRRALRMYRRAGFEIIGVRRGYYRAPGGTEDAVVLVRRFQPDPPA